MSIQCQVCKQTFLQTTKAPAYVEYGSLRVCSMANVCSLLEHASNKHKKGLADCFPGVSQ